MATRALVQRLGALTSYRYGVDSYDSTKLGLGPLMTQNNGGAEASYAGPVPIGVAHPAEQAVAIPATYPWSMRWQANAAGDIDWVFLADNAAAAATRRIMMYTFDRRLGLWSWVGFVTVTFPTGTNYTIRGFEMTYDLYTTGTVTGSSGSTAITGSGTAWSTSRIPTGCRIGFGSTDPTQITVWYGIATVGSDSSITLATNLASNVSGAYVIEDLRAVMATTNATTTNGGLCVVKGLRKELFTSLGGAVPAATTVDSALGCYWIADASTVLNIAALGLALAAKTGWTNQTAYVIDATSTPTIFAYNIRGALTLSGGKDTTSLLFRTGATTAIAGGTPSQLNNFELATANHGPGAGKSCLYFTTPARVYRTIEVGAITTGSTLWVADAMVETPPGGLNTYPAGGNFQTLAYIASIDKFVITQATGTTAYRNYVTQYRTDSAPLDRAWGTDIRQTDITTTDSSVTPVPSHSTQVHTVYCDTGMCYLAGTGGTAATNRVYAVPFGADWEYTGAPNNTKSYLVLPAWTMNDAVQFTNVFVNDVQVLGGKTGNNLGLGTEPLRVSYRTSGISDDSGVWTPVDSTGVITDVGSTQIQLRIEFRTIGVTCIPARVCAVGVVYNDITTDTHYQPSVANSNTFNKQFAWRFATAFGGTVPTLRVRLYDAVSGGLLVDDNTASPTGTWDKSTNGGTTWAGVYDTNDKTNETTYIRYTPAALGNNTKVRALLTLNV